MSKEKDEKPQGFDEWLRWIAKKAKEIEEAKKRRENNA